jgi:pilus assembly protein Flp/PilA
MLRRFIRDEEAATAIEYALIAGLIAAVVIGAIEILGPGIQGAFQNIVDTLESATTTP